MPGLFDDIIAENGGGASSGCLLERLIKSLEPDDKVDLDRALDNLDITTSAIHRALRKNGHQVSIHTVGRHRRKECCCGQTG